MEQLELLVKQPADLMKFRVHNCQSREDETWVFERMPLGAAMKKLHCRQVTQVDKNIQYQFVGVLPGLVYSLPINEQFVMIYYLPEDSSENL